MVMPLASRMKHPLQNLGRLGPVQAKEDLEKVRVICGTDCEAYRLLRSAIDGTVTY
jgi:hypothetical protein